MNGRSLRWLYRLLLRQQLTVGRGAVIAFLGGLFLVANLGVRIGVDDADERISAAVEVNWLFGIALVVPIISLVLGSSSLGELTEDETLVYLWHRPTPRWVLAVAAWASSVTVAVPAAVIPVAGGALLASSDVRTTATSALVAALGAIAYSSVFVLLGLVVRRALIWGLVYVFIWEQFVARIGGNSSKISIGAYPSSVLQDLTDVELPRADRGLWLGVLVPIALAALGVLATARALDRIDVA